MAIQIKQGSLLDFLIAPKFLDQGIDLQVEGLRTLCFGIKRNYQFKELLELCWTLCEDRFYYSENEGRDVLVLFH